MGRQSRSVNVMFRVRVHVGGLVSVVMVADNKAEAKAKDKEEAWVGSHAGCQ